LDTDAVINGTFPIDSAGYADLPVMGRVYVNNKSVKLIEDFVSKEMAQYLRDPHLSVRPAYRLTFLGNWQRPGMHWVDAEASVWEAAKVAGGPVNEIELDDWYIMRGYSNVSSDILADFARGSSLREAGVRSGDIFVIPIPNPTVGFWPHFKDVLAVTAQLAGTAAALATVYVTYLIYEGTRPIHSTTVCGVPANTAPTSTTNSCSTTVNNQ
jgi:protein involved in polysaccharide export with SLBB domain